MSSWEGWGGEQLPCSKNVETGAQYEAQVAQHKRGAVQYEAQHKRGAKKYKTFRGEMYI